MWLFISRRIRMYLLLTVLVPLGTRVLRSLGRKLESKNGPSAISKNLIKAGDLAENGAAKLRGRRR
ncbi:hypothetical protein ASG36_08750 [Geodermatophilus sp. Leaf369]|uniref:hypothetical protein n=1 Tax=Geodermatophilus sp. Leaf369 TaxID=1736354 RepID=UPI0006F585DC|nr:hypothetical protein [Geodermatophilus sp. Leaf369]KQS60912.1 hypothetical protein ASG36_08750 [Geodermatophilus sp. Leaf369]QNG36983.1 hypothetical protein F1C76_10620 [Geodermatophilaceae bacterium NBWT11]